MYIKCCVCKELKEVRTSALKRRGITADEYRCRDCYIDTLRTDGLRAIEDERRKREERIKKHLVDIVRKRHRRIRG